MEHTPHALITGGTGYALGEAVKRFVSLGWHVTLLARSDAKQEGVSTRLCDLRDEAAIAVATTEAIEEYGAPTIVIHGAAAPLSRTRPSETPVEKLKEEMDIALYAMHALVRATSVHMAPGAAYVGVTTEAIEETGPIGPYGGYLPAKQALKGYLRALSSEFSAKGIRVYALAPGFMLGGLNSDLPEQVRTLIASKEPEFVATPEQVADAVIRIATMHDAFASGVTVHVPGEGTTPL